MSLRNKQIIYTSVFLSLFMGIHMICPEKAFAQDCGCDYYIETEEQEIWYVPAPSPYRHQKHWDLKRRGETVICLKSGIRDRLYIRNFNGGMNSDGSRYVFKNCGGLVEIKAPNNDGIVFYNCQDIKISGRGDSSLTYGIKISETRSTGTNYGNAFGISIQGYSEKFEIEYLEITNTGFAAITAKTDQGKYYPDKKTEFILDDLKFHHNYIHDLKKGEGFYVGHNQWNDSTQHRLNGVYIFKNRLENIPWDGIQIGGTKNEKTGVAGNAEIYENSIINYGADKNPLDPWQANGINLSSGFSGKCYNNLIQSGKDTRGGNGIITGGIGDVWIFNNIIVEPMQTAVYVNALKNTTDAGRAFYIYNNTILRPKGLAVDYERAGAPGFFINNLVVSDHALSSTCRSCKLTLRNNFLTRNADENLFVNPVAGDYRLKPTAKGVIDSGEDLSKKPFNLSYDFKGTKRSGQGKAFDIGAMEYKAPKVALEK